ncbi:MAG: hypothetical protein ACSHYA_17170 [Opitutaceae bacterium]
MKASDQELLDCYFQARASDEQVAELEARMLADPDLRQRYLQEAMTETALRSFALQENEVPSAPSQEQASLPPARKSPLTRFLIAGSLAACLALSLWINQKTAPSAGVILSSELAGWQSEYSTIDGAEFAQGVYTLQTGIVTLGFHSGAEMVLEGPARIEVVSDMQIIFDYGNASFFVPDSAIGFQVNTRLGNVVDHGTRFSLSLGEDESEARLAVDEGEIAIHHNDGSVKHLVTTETARMDEESIHFDADLTSEGWLEIGEPLVVLKTNGRETTVVHSKLKDKKLRTDVLMVKNISSSARYYLNRKAQLAFDVSEVDLDQIDHVRLILNAVPTGVGMSSGMPKVSEFGVYGIPDGQHENWSTSGLLWEDAPQIEETRLLETFSVPRANLRQVVVLEGPELLEFLKSDRTGEVGFIIHCETPGSSMIHGFASSQHREAAGPTLELVMK